MEVIVVDNNSTDGSAHYIQAIFPQLRYHIRKENAGFAKSCNYGLQLSLGSHVLFLNPDTIVPEDCFEKCLHFLSEHPNAGALGVRMIDGSGAFLKESKRGNPTLLNSFFKLSGFSSLVPRSACFSGYYMAHLNEHQTNPVNILAGAFMMISKNVLDKTGGFDEQFFMYGEDIDLSYRIEKAGYRNYYFPEVSIVHFKGESTQKDSHQYVETFYNAMRIFVRKHYKGSRSFIYRHFIDAACFISKKTNRALTTGGSDVVNINQHIILAGSAESIETARQIAKKAGFNATELNQTETGLIQNYPMVLCEGEKMSFKRIIQDLDEKKLSNAMIHANGSKSIVGSPGKHKRGNTIHSKEM